MKHRRTGRNGIYSSTVRATARARRAGGEKTRREPKMLVRQVCAWVVYMCGVHREARQLASLTEPLATLLELAP